MGVGVADAGVIAVDGITLRLLRDRAFFRDAFVAAELAGLVASERRCAGRQLLVFGEMDIVVTVHVPISFRRDPGHVWLVEADGEEERLVLDLVHHAHGFVGDLAIEQPIVGDFGRLVGQHIGPRLVGFGSDFAFARLRASAVGLLLDLWLESCLCVWIEVFPGASVALSPPFLL